MEKKEFLEITKKAFQDYGFIVDGKYYYLDLDDVFICATLFPVLGSHTLSYNFSIKSIHDYKDRKRNDIFTGYDCILCDTFNSKGNKFIDYKEITKEDYIKDLSHRLHKYFDPFKANALNHILKGRIKEKNRFAIERFMITKKAQDFFGIDLSK